MTETTDTDEPVVPAADSGSPEPEESVTGYRYTGHDERTYPHRRHPVTGAVLVVEPDEVLDFGGELPPGDGLWYDVSSGEQYTDSPASTGAGETEE